MREKLVNQVRRFLAPPPVSRDEVRQIIEGPRANAVVIDTRGGEEYTRGHLPGAISVPNDDEFPVGILRAVPDKDRKVILYSRNRGCGMAYEAARKMELLGYSNVSVFEDGNDGW